MAGHTPGPWFVEPPWSGFSAVKTTDGKLVFGLAAGAPEEKRSDAECEANARLIAAAPAMLEALQAAKRYIFVHGPGVTEEAGVLGLIDGALDIVAGRKG